MSKTTSAIVFLVIAFILVLGITLWANTQPVVENSGMQNPRSSMSPSPTATPSPTPSPSVSASVNIQY